MLSCLCLQCCCYAWPFFVYVYWINTYNLCDFFLWLCFHVYFHFMDHMVSFASAHLPEVPCLATYCTCFPIHWALSWCMALSAVSAWQSLVCCNLHLSSLGALWVSPLLYLIKWLDLCQIIQHCACALCTSTLLAHTTTSLLAICTLLVLDVSSLIILSI